MFIRILLRWLLYAFILGTLSACGGGSDEASNLLDDKGTDGTTTDPDTTTPTTVSVLVTGETVVAVGDNTATITITTLDGTSTTTTATVPNVPFRVSVTGSARFSNGEATLDAVSNSQGQSTLTITDSSLENVLVSFSGRDNYTGSFSFSVYFGGTVTASISPAYPTTIIAGGSDTATLTVQARDATGLPIVDQNVSLSFAQGSFATASTTETTSVTNSQGQFVATITNTVAQDTSVTPVVGGYTVKPALAMRFGASTVYTNPTAVDLLVAANNVPADGTTTARLLVVARDDAGVPVTNVPISISISSGSAQLSTNGSTYQPVFINGNTGSAGNFSVYIKNTVEEDVTLTASARITNSDSTTAIISDSVTITFKNTVVDPTTTVTISSVTLDAPIYTPVAAATANGTDTASIVGRVLYSDSTPVANTTVSFLTSNGLSIPNATTDSAGFFRISLTSTTVVSYTLRAVVAGISSSSITVAFIARATTPDTETPTSPSNVTLIASPSSTLADGTSSITLTAIVRDSTSTPMTGIQVSISAAGTAASTALFDNGIVKTGSSGTAVFKLTNTVAGSVSVTASAVALTTAGIPSGTTVTDTEVVTFTNPATQVAQLDVSCSPVGTSTGTDVTCGTGLKANGTDQATISVVARDSTGKPVANAPIIILGTGGAAVADPSSGVTNSNGFFSASVTSTDVGPADFTVTVENVSTGGSNIAKNVRINFEATAGTAPAFIDVEAINSPQPADGTSKIILVVTPRDSTNTPITGAAVEIFVDSINATITGSTGTTNSLGEYRATVTSTVAEENISVVAVSSGVRSDKNSTPLKITFTSGTTLPANQIPDSLVLTVSQPSIETGSNIEVTLLARKNNSPLGDVPIVLSATGDIAGSTIFTAFSGKTATTSGAFTTTVTSSKAGTVTIQARLNATNVVLTSNAIELTFNPSSGSTADIASLELLSSSSTLNSEGDSDGVTITGLVKDSKNNLLSDVTINFSSVCGIPSTPTPADGLTVTTCESVDPTTSESRAGAGGELLPILISGTTTGTPGVTDTSGRAQARLTTQSNADNRYITVIASVSKGDGTTLQKAISVKVIGTTLNITGPSSLIINNVGTYVITLRNSKNDPLAGQTLLVTSANGNNITYGQTTATQVNVVTDVSGRAEITLQASTGLSNQGILTDTLSASKPGASAITPATLAISISTDQLEVVPVTANADCLSITDCQIPIGQTQQFRIVWTQASGPISGDVQVTSTRGTLTPGNTVSLDADTTCKTTPFVANCFTLTSADAGVATVSISGIRTTPPPPSITFNITFIATTASKLTLQASSTVLSTNTAGSTDQQSEITAIVRDANDNLVSNKTVTFVLTDVTGGSLTQGSAITDAFGRATTTYIAGTTTSSTDGVKITVAVDGLSEIISLTVGQRSLFVTVASGNVIEDDQNLGIRYKLPHTVLVTDSNGSPVNNSVVTLSIYPHFYIRGSLSASTYYQCINEDTNRNGILDSGEDLNSNGTLDPGGVITLDALTVTTGPTTSSPNTSAGFADFNVVYAKQYANYLIDVELKAQTTVSGSEASDSLSFVPPCSKADADAETCPVSNPFASTAALLGGCTLVTQNTGVVLADSQIPDLVTLVITPPTINVDTVSTDILGDELGQLTVVAQKIDPTSPTGKIALSGIPITLYVDPVATPDIKGSIVFGASSGTTTGDADTGSFVTTIKGLCPGQVSITARIEATNSNLPISNVATVTFVQPTGAAKPAGCP